MRFRLQATQNGTTVFDAEAGECFKSRHSARLEAEEVFFRPGIAENPWRGRALTLRVLELGFGLGTNFSHLKEKNLPLELLSIDRDLAGARFYVEQVPDSALSEILNTRELRRGPFTAKLWEEDFFRALPALVEKGERFHAVYFDPFSPKANPEAWTRPLFNWCYDLLQPEGRLVTYSVSRAAKDAAQAAGFRVEKRDLPAELQKRSALLAIRS